MFSVSQTFELALQFHRAGDLHQAELLYEQILRIDPQHADALHLFGLLAHQVGRNDLAVEYIQKALRHRPDYVLAYNNLGSALREQGKFDEAIACFRHALRLMPDYAVAHHNLGNVLKDQGELDEAIACFRQALRLMPTYVAAHDNLVFTLHFHPDSDAGTLYREALRWNEQHAKPLTRINQPHANTADPKRKLRIGYVSPDFRNHSAANFLMPLLANHDRSQVEIFCYAEVARPVDMTERLRAYADTWRTTVGFNGERVEGMVREDRIDILVDLAVHTANNRLLVFARKPAPVQVTWCGYPGTTGLSTVDYRLTDPYLDPPGETDFYYSEQSVRLPDTFGCYDPLSDQPLSEGLPALASGYFTFGCLNSFCKVNDGVLSLWTKVLRAVPHSRLLMLAPKGHERDHVLANLTQQGIDVSRLEFADRLPRQQYLQTYNRIDLALDPSPYSGYITNLDAFWMGVPTMTLIGRTAVGRMGWSQLNNLGLQELAARTPEEYIALAVRLAGDLPRLQDLRIGLRSRMRASPLMDGQRFARHMEQAFRQMWRKWCQERETTK
jgi:protein O-GlcNAc transferase